MSYDTGTPQATDRVSDTQQPILTNFQQLNVIYGEDHYDYTVQTSNEGFHRAVHLPSAAGIPSSAANVGVMYSKTGTSRTFPFWRRDGGSVDYPMLPIKAWGVINPSGESGDLVPLVQGFNVNGANISYVGTGNYSIPFLTNMLSTNYCVLATASHNSGQVNAVDVGGTAMGAFALRVTAVTNSGTSSFDPDYLSFVVIEV